MKGVIIQGFDLIENITEYKLNLIPHPQIVYEIKGFLKLKKELDLIFKEVSSEEVILEVITEELSAIGKYHCQKSQKEFQVDLSTYKFHPATSKEESYILRFDENYVVIVAESDKGIYYGVNTFLQLVKLINNDLVIPKMDIIDYPAYQIRCITDQTSRNQIPTVENLKTVIKLLSKFKLNYHFLYIEDGFHFKKYPDIGEARGGYSAEEIKEIQEYAKRYFIEIIPIFNSFGHQDNILMTNYPKYAHLGEYPGAASFDIGNPELRTFIIDLYQEICSAFDSSYLHLGLDETFDFGKYRTKQLIKEKGKGNLMLEYYNFLIKNVRKLGKEKLICYHDNVLGEKELLKHLPKDLIVFYWDYWVKTWFIFPKHKYKKAKKLRENGYSVILSPTLYDYTRNFPDTKLTVKNVVGMARYGLEIGAIGLATSVWGDFLMENLRENNYFGYLVTAEAAWSPLRWDEARFKNNFAFLFYGTANEEIIKAIEDLNVYNDLYPGYPLRFFSHFHRHPFPARKINPKCKKLNRILQKNENALQIIKRIKPKTKKHLDNLDYLEYAAKLGVYLAKKYLIAKEIQSQLNQGNYNSEELIEKVTYLKKYLEDLKKNYNELWLRAAKPNGLEIILEKFDANIFFYQQKIQEIKDGITWKDPFLKAEFITAPQKVQIGEPIFLRKTFTVKKPVKRCHIQGMCDMVMHLYLNGEKLTEIVSKMSLSVEPIKQRIQLIDITDKIKPGTNVMGAECYNYLISRVAGNIYLEILYADGETEVMFSNSEWKANQVKEPNWNTLEFNDSHWMNAKSLGAAPKIGGHITSPNIQAGIKSQESYYYAMDTFLKSLMPVLPLSLVEFAKKIVGLDVF